MRRISDILDNSVVIPNDRIRTLDKNKVGIGRKVKIKFNSGEEKIFKIGGASPLDGFISYLSPLAKSMEGMGVGDFFSYQVHENGEIFSGEILSVEFAEEFMKK